MILNKPPKDEDYENAIKELNIANLLDPDDQDIVHMTLEISREFDKYKI